MLLHFADIADKEVLDSVEPAAGILWVPLPDKAPLERVEGASYPKGQ
jgi:hypothetical protein